MYRIPYHSRIHELLESLMGLHTLQPVSYTHLDVYKRQAHDGAASRITIVTRVNTTCKWGINYLIAARCV